MALDGQLLAETEVTTRWSNRYLVGSADGHPLRVAGDGKSPFGEVRDCAKNFIELPAGAREKKSDSRKLIVLPKRHYRRGMEPSLHRAFH